VWPNTIFGPSYAEIALPYHSCFEHRSEAHPDLVTQEDWDQIDALFGQFLGAATYAGGIEIEARLTQE
jgi:hypothetical protein